MIVINKVKPDHKGNNPLKNNNKDVKSNQKTPNVPKLNLFVNGVTKKEAPKLQNAKRSVSPKRYTAEETKSKDKPPTQALTLHYCHSSQQTSYKISKRAEAKCEKFFRGTDSNHQPASTAFEQTTKPKKT